ncbi:hypothetical protein M6B38_283850 [Iris pallida]|uniref:Uncharacterized protein n=1 Tax=Iris pallida TaxID=29817 RepID=A0AAX6I1L9_IRIPA|nr:hypothetical protein M6B38_283850 [Iris pallida]
MSQAVRELLEACLDNSLFELGSFSKQAELELHFRARLINEPSSSLEVLGLFELASLEVLSPKKKKKKKKREKEKKNMVMMIWLGFPPPYDGEAAPLQPFVRRDKENGGSISTFSDDGSKLNLSLFFVAMYMAANEPSRS